MRVTKEVAFEDAIVESVVTSGYMRGLPATAIENAVGLAAAANVTTTIHHVDGRDVCRVHVEPSGHPVEAETTVADERGQFGKKQQFYVRLNNGTRAIEDERERQRFIVQRWGRA